MRSVPFELSSIEGLDELVKQEKAFTSPHPDITLGSAQIASAKEPTFNNQDVIEDLLLEQKRQLKEISMLDNLIHEAQGFIPFLYAYRSVQITLNRSEAIREIVKTTKSEILPNYTKEYVDFFQPTYQRLVALCSYFDRVTTFLVNILTQVEYIPSPVIFEKLELLLDTLFNIEMLKLRKAGINTDLSFYKRGLSQKDVSAMVDFNKLQLFLSQGFKIFDDLRGMLIGKDTKSDVSFKKVEAFLQFEVKTFKTPPVTPMKFSRTLTSILSVLMFHSSDSSKTNICSAKIMNEVSQILVENPIGSLYGENSFTMDEIIQKIPQLKSNKAFQFDDLATKKYQQKYLVCQNLNSIKKEVQDSLQLADQISRDLKVQVDNLYSFLDIMSKMSLMVLLQSKYKFIVKAKPPKNEDFLNYDLIVKYNYTSDDLSSLVEIIGYIKSLASILASSEGVITECVFSYIDSTLQDLAQNILEVPLQAAKSSNPSALNVLEGIKTTFGIWGDGASVSKKKSQAVQITGSPAIISQHQIDALRAQVFQLTQSDSICVKKDKGNKPVMKEETIKKIHTFLDISGRWSNLINYISVVKDTTNLGSLWFRELFIDFDKVIIFPVRSSLPFILAEHLLKLTDHISLHDSFLYPFELYNDAAAMAIKTFDSQYLYKEIESEANLCIEMITFTFVDALYKVCRATAASLELPPECINRIELSPTRYDLILLQNKIELLGSHIDFNQIATSKLNQMMSQEIANYVNLLTDIRLLPYISHLMNVLERTHMTLCEKNLQVDDFQMICSHALGLDNPLLVESSLLTQLLKVLTLNYFRYNCITRRFLSTKKLKIEPLSNEKWASEYASIHQTECEFFGIEHVNSIMRIFSKAELAVFVTYCIDRVIETLSLVVDSYAAVAPVLRLLPCDSKADSWTYFKFNSDGYSGLTHPSMGKLFDSLRTLGNFIALIWFFEPEVLVNAKGLSINASLMSILKEFLLRSKDLFIDSNGLDLESTISHRSFPTLWSVLEVIYCSPNPLPLRQNESVIPMDVFGDSPAIAAHVIITLTGQEYIYQFDSPCFRSLQLFRTESDTSQQRDEKLDSFLRNCAIVEQARRFASIVAFPYRLEL